MAMTDHPRRSVIAAVDDDQRILKSLEILLESADYDVRLFSSAGD
jgi:FixJ family two-component response regulator